MIELYHQLITAPLLNILVGLYNTIAFQDLGIAIALLTLLIRLAFFPLFQKSLVHQKKMQEIQPEIKKLQKKHKGNMEEQSKALMALYKEHNFNPFSGIGVMIVQIPILLALYQLFLGVFKEGALDRLYGFIANPGALDPVSLGFFDLSQPYFWLVLVTAILQFIQARMSLAKASNMEPSQKMTMQITTLIVPIITLVIFSRLAAAVSVYWLVSSLLSLLQQYIVNYRDNNKKKNETSTA